MSTEGRKFFFDVNNFDGPATPEPEEDLPPPPPVFSEEELAAAKAEGFVEGRSIGQQEEQQSRAQYIATQISELNTQILSLILSEQIREKRFEQEVIHLCRALISKAFPVLCQREGYSEIEAIMTRVIEKQPRAQIHIEVPTADLEEIKSHLFSIKDIEPERLQIIGAADLGKGSCRMKWQDGGATRDYQALASAIFKELDEVLAPPPQKVQNNESEPITTDGDQNG